jgi:exodeoxyribonuclease V gamma subunit
VPLGPHRRDGRLVLDPEDASVRVHSCHGRARQVEVLREAILHRLADDPSLEPRDVIVMCPDIETFAPLIQATFGEAPDGDRIALPVRLADRSLRQTNPVLGVLGRLLELPESRLAASEVLDLADRPPVRRRFGFDDDELAQLREWVVAAGIHWGLDAAQREEFKLGGVGAGTWQFGLRRLLLGVTMSEAGNRTFERVLPLDDLPSGRIALAGRAAEFVARLGRALQGLHGPHSLEGWAQALTSAIDTLTAVDDADAWQRRELDWILADATADSALAEHTAQLALPEIRALLAERLAGRPTRANFRTGQLTICTLMPMRSVPHRVVCLLGLDDGVFPRQAPHDGDNVLLADPRPGDRDPRREDRQLLLDALMAAGDALIITYTGNDERTNAPRPPAVPVGELLDAIDGTAHAADGAPASEQVRVVHPLQPFDTRNFAAGALVGDAPWSYDRLALAAARAATAERAPAAPFLDRELPPVQETDAAITLSDLIAFVEHPARAFLRHRLGVSLSVFDDELADGLPIELDGLDSWAVGQRLLETVLDGVPLREAALAELARGSLPPGELGRPALQGIWHQVELLAASASAHVSLAAAQPRSVETNLVLGDGARLTGTVSGVRDHVALSVGYGRLGARHRLAAWVRLLALSAAHPELPHTAVTIGRSSGDVDLPVTVATIAALGAEPEQRRATAIAVLGGLLSLYREGMRRPLALPSEVGAAWAGALRGGEDPVAAANRAWYSRWRHGRYHRGEDLDPEHALVFGAELPLADLERFAERLWSPLLTRETVQSR